MSSTSSLLPSPPPASPPTGPQWSRSSLSSSTSSTPQPCSISARATACCSSATENGCSPARCGPRVVVVRVQHPGAEGTCRAGLGLARAPCAPPSNHRHPLSRGPQVILIHLSNLTGLKDDYSKRTMRLLVSDIGTIVFGVTSACSTGYLKIVFFLLGLLYGCNTYFHAAKVRGGRAAERSGVAGNRGVGAVGRGGAAAGLAEGSSGSCHAVQPPAAHGAARKPEAQRPRPTSHARWRCHPRPSTPAPCCCCCCCCWDLLGPADAHVVGTHPASHGLHEQCNPA